MARIITNKIGSFIATGGGLSQSVAETLFAAKGVEAAVARVDPGTAGSARQHIYVNAAGEVDWAEPIGIDLINDIGLVPNNQNAATWNHDQLTGFLATVPANAPNTVEKVIIGGSGRFDFSDTIDLSGLNGIAFSGNGGVSQNDGSGFGLTFAQSPAFKTSGAPLVLIDNPTQIHQGPRFQNMTLWARYGGKSLHVETTNRVHLLNVGLRGAIKTEVLAGDAFPAEALFYGSSQGGGIGGPVATGDASWGSFVNCNLGGVFGKGYWFEGYGAPIIGGEITLESPDSAWVADAIAFYGFTRTWRVYGIKVDAGIMLDVSGRGAFHNMHFEAWGGTSYPIRIGMRPVYLNPGEIDPPPTRGEAEFDATWGFALSGSITGHSTTGAVRLGPWALGNLDVDLSAFATVASPLVDDQSGNRARERSRVRVYRLGSPPPVNASSDSAGRPTLGLFGAPPKPQPAPLTPADMSVVNSGDATTDAVIDNLRTRLNQLERAAAGIVLPPMPPTTNAVANPVGATDASGWSAGASTTLIRTAALPTTEGLPGDVTTGFSATATANRTGADNGAAAYAHTVSGAGLHAFSAYVYIPAAWTGGQVMIRQFGFDGATQYEDGYADMTLRDQWQRVWLGNVTIAAGDLTGSMQLSARASWVSGQALYFTAVQSEPNALPTAFVIGSRS